MMTLILISIVKITQSLSYLIRVNERNPEDQNIRKVSREQWYSRLAVALASILGLPVLIVSWGHWWQLLVFFSWWFAFVSMGRGQPKTAGLSLALAIGLEPWGILGVLPTFFLVGSVAA